MDALLKYLILQQNYLFCIWFFNPTKVHMSRLKENCVPVISTITIQIRNSISNL